MTMQTAVNRVRRAVPVLVLAVFALGLAACGEKKADDRKQAVRQTDSYSAESIYAELKKKLAENPNDSESWYHLADLYDRNGQYAEAVDAYRKVVELKPDMGYSYFKMGTAYSRMNKPEEAVAAFRSAEKYLRDYPVLYNNLGIAFGKMGKTDDEIAALKKAIRFRPNYAAARYNLGIAYLRKGNRSAALEQHKALLNFDEGTAEALQKEIDKQQAGKQ